MVMDAAGELPLLLRAARRQPQGVGDNKGLQLPPIHSRPPLILEDDAIRSKTARSQLCPTPPRSCSRQTGAIVYRHYDDGRNPFTVQSPQLPVVVATEHHDKIIGRPLRSTAASARHAPPRSVVPSPSDTSTIILTVRQAEEQVKTARRRQCLHSHHELLKQQHVVESSKVDRLVRAVMALNSIDAAIRSPSFGRSQLRQSSFRSNRSFMMPIRRMRSMGRTDSTLRSSGNNESSSRRRLGFVEEKLTVESVQLLHREFETLQLDHTFEGSLSTGAPLLIGGALLSAAQLKRCLNAAGQVDFDALVGVLRPDLPEAQVSTVLIQWKKHRAELCSSSTASFREIYDLAAIRNVEHGWAAVMRLVKGQPRYIAAQQTHEAAISREQFQSYVASLQTALTADDASKLFDAHCVPGGLLPDAAAVAAGGPHRRRSGVKMLIDDASNNGGNEPRARRASQVRLRRMNSSPIDDGKKKMQRTDQSPPLSNQCDVLTLEGFARTLVFSNTPDSHVVHSPRDAAFTEPLLPPAIT